MRIVFLSALLIATPAKAAETFGAIAYSPKTGAHGWAKDHPTRVGAQKAALAACSKHASDCRPAVWFKNACGAIAVNAKGSYYWAWGTTQQLADDEAMKICGKQGKGCKVTIQVCTTGSG